MTRSMGVKGVLELELQLEWVVVSWKGCGDTSRRKTVKEWKGGEMNKVEEREASVAEKRCVRRSKTAIWWMSLWRWGTSEGVARRIRENRGWPTGVESESGRPVGGDGAGAGGGGGAAAAILVSALLEVRLSREAECVLVLKEQQRNLL